MLTPVFSFAAPRFQNNMRSTRSTTAKATKKRKATKATEDGHVVAYTVLDISDHEKPTLSPTCGSTAALYYQWVTTYYARLLECAPPGEGLTAPDLLAWVRAKLGLDVLTQAHADRCQQIEKDRDVFLSKDQCLDERARKAARQDAVVARDFEDRKFNADIHDALDRVSPEVDNAFNMLVDYQHALYPFHALYADLDIDNVSFTTMKELVMPSALAAKQPKLPVCIIDDVQNEDRFARTSLFPMAADDNCLPLVEVAMAIYAVLALAIRACPETEVRHSLRKARRAAEDLVWPDDQAQVCTKVLRAGLPTILEEEPGPQALSPYFAAMRAALDDLQAGKPAHFAEAQRKVMDELGERTDQTITVHTIDVHVVDYERHGELGKRVAKKMKFTRQ